MYTFKPNQWSSHSILLRSLPAEGKGARVLDVGCGDGYLGSLLAERGYRVTGIEREGGFSSRFPRSVELIVADLDRGVPVLRDQFQYILCADILEHLRHPDEILRQLRPLLLPGGQMIASLPNSGNIWFRGNIVLGRFPQDDKGLFDRTHIRFYMWRGWQKLFEDAGFRITRMQPTAIPVSLTAPAGWQNSLPVEIAESVFYGLARIWAKMFSYQFVICAEALDG